MRFTLIIDIADEDIAKASQELEITEDELINGINNTCYLGMDCIDAMVQRQYEISLGDSFVSSIVGDDETVHAD